MDPSAAAERELEMTDQLREDAGMAPLIGTSGDAAFAALDAIEEEFAEQLISDVAAVVDAGTVPQGATALPTGLIASIGGIPPIGDVPHDASHRIVRRI